MFIGRGSSSLPDELPRFAGVLQEQGRFPQRTANMRNIILFMDIVSAYTENSVYMKGIQPEVLQRECVEKIDWGVDWETLKVKWN